MDGAFPLFKQFAVICHQLPCIVDTVFYVGHFRQGKHGFAAPLPAGCIIGIERFGITGCGQI